MALAVRGEVRVMSSLPSSSRCQASPRIPQPRILPGMFKSFPSLTRFAAPQKLLVSHTNSIPIKRSLRTNVFHQPADAAAAASRNENEEFALSARCRAVLFYLTSALVALPLFVVMLLQQPLVLLLDKQRRKAQHLVNKVWAVLSTYLFCKVEILGEENLPHPDEPAVYVANHQSFLDIFVLFQLGRPFKFISKTSVFWIPIVGWSMFLTGHIPLHRSDAKSQLDCLRRCIECLKRGVSVLFFPEGTRSLDGTLGVFKKGAFSCAAKARVPVVPITLVGTGNLMPTGKEYLLKTGRVKMIIHPPLQDGNADELCIQARNCIATSLLKNL